jgi:hypothetical protein
VPPYSFGGTLSVSGATCAIRMACSPSPYSLPLCRPLSLVHQPEANALRRISGERDGSSTKI